MAIQPSTVTAAAAAPHRTGEGRITTAIRSSDGANVATELYASYPVRLHVTSRPNSNNNNINNSNEKQEQEEQYHHRRRRYRECKALSCYILGYGGGLVSGDTLTLSFTVKPHASLVMTSQSTTKAFKHISGRSSTVVRTNATVERGALLVVIPQPTQCFTGSRLIQETTATIVTTSEQEEMGSLLMVDWYTGGRPHWDQGVWELDFFQSTMTIMVTDDDGSQKQQHHRVIFNDATRLTGGRTLKSHMRGYHTIGMVLLVGERVKMISNVFRQRFLSRNDYDDDVAAGKGGSLTETGGGWNGSEGLMVSCGTFDVMMGGDEKGVIVRVAAQSIEQAASFLSQHIGTVDGQLENDPFLEILASRQQVNQSLNNNDNRNNNSRSMTNGTRHVSRDQDLSFDLIDQSFTVHDTISSSSNDNHRNKLPPPPPNDNNNGTAVLPPPPSPITIYQLVDASLPTGGFAHSNTVEVAHQLRFITDASSLRRYTWDVLLQTMTSVLPYVIYSRRIMLPSSTTTTPPSLSSRRHVTTTTTPDQITLWMSLDSTLTLTTTSHVARRASVAQGSALRRTFAQSFPRIAPSLKLLKRSLLLRQHEQGGGGGGGHAATSFGAIGGLLQLEERTTVSLFLYNVVRDMMNAAVRLNIVGPLEGAALVNELGERWEEYLGGEWGGIGGDDDGDGKREGLRVVCCQTGTGNCGDDVRKVVHQCAPLVEILANAHDRLYTRLFNS